MSKEVDWEVDEIIILKEDYDLSRLPDSPHCKNLLKLSIQVSGLTEIPPTFFEHMPLLEELDLSTTNIQSLPSSISSLTSLQKLFLRDCSGLMELPSEIRMLTKLKLLDCEGSEIMYIPKEIGELNDLEVLRVSLSLYADYFLKTKPVNDSVKIPRNILSKLTKLKELCITTCPEAEWWEEEVKEIQDDLCHLEYLETLKWYLPTKMVLDRFLQIKREGKRIYENLSNFTLTIGRHPQLTSCLPANLQKKFENFEKCLKWINAEGNEKDISMIMERAEALFLSRHWTIVRLSDFDLAKLKYCLLAECNEMETLVEVDELSEDVERIGKVGLESIEYLTVHHMEKFQSIWKGPMGKDSLSSLRILALHTCPKLTTIFTMYMAQNLSRLTELTVEDCHNVTSLISNESPNIATGPLFPCLEKIFLLDLPELDSIFRGKIILEKVDSLLVYNCLKLQDLSVTELPNIQKINGEKEWWNDLKCDKSRWQNVFEQLKEERHLIEQLAEATNSLQHFHDILSRDAKGKKPLDRSSWRSNFPIGEQGLSLSQLAAKDEKLLGGSALRVSEIKSDISNFPLEEQEGVSLSRPGMSKEVDWEVDEMESEMEIDSKSVKVLTLTNEYIKTAYFQSIEPHKPNQLYLINSKKHGASSSLTEVLIIAFKGPSSNWYNDDHFGETDVDVHLFPSLLRIGEDLLAKVNSAFLHTFKNLLESTGFKLEVEKAMKKGKKILFAGHASGGAIASLATLWVLEEYARKKKVSNAIGCVTFGSPLIGDGTVTHAVQREKWGGHFTHFVMEHDIVPRILLAPKTSIQKHLPTILDFLEQKVDPSYQKSSKKAKFFNIKTHEKTVHHDHLVKHDEAIEFFENVMINASTVASHDAIDLMEPTSTLKEKLKEKLTVSPYRPFGHFVFCTRDETQGSGTSRQQLVVENPNAVLQLLFYFLQFPNENQNLADFALNSLAENFSYEEELNNNGLHLDNMVNLKDLNQHLLTSNGTTGDVIRASNRALSEQTASAKWCLVAIEEAEKRKKENELVIKKSMRKYSKPNQKIIEDILDEIHKYKKKHGDGTLDYYEAFKNQNEQDDFVANVNRLEQAKIWDLTVEMVLRRDLLLAIIMFINKRC